MILKITLTLCLILLSPVPRLFPGLIRNMIFLPNDFGRKIHADNVPVKQDYDHTDKYGFVAGRNFYLQTSDGVTLGVWHLLPSSLEAKSKDIEVKNVESAYNDWLRDSNVFLYVHGSAGTRTSVNRLSTYSMLTKMDYHVVAFDFRGYGDSTSNPKSEKDLVLDTLTVYNWIHKLTGNIYFWGHSLGSGVAAHAANKVVGDGNPVKGLVLEAPFNNMADAVRTNMYIKPIVQLPWFKFFFIQPLEKNDLSFDSEKYLSTIPTPVLILHAKDDIIVPYILGYKLYQSLLASRANPATVQMISYDTKHYFGHFNIAMDPDLKNIIRSFVEKTS